MEGLLHLLNGKSERVHNVPLPPFLEPLPCIVALPRVRRRHFVLLQGLIRIQVTFDATMQQLRGENAGERSMVRTTSDAKPLL